MNKNDLILSSDFQRDPETELPKVHVHRHFFATIENLIAAHGDQEIVVDVNTKQSQTAQEFITNAKKIASAFLKRGLKRGQVICFYSNNNINYFSTLLASWMCGAILSPTYHFYQEDYITGLVNKIQPVFMICDEHTAECALLVQKKTGFPKNIFVFGDHESCISVSDVLKDDDLVIPEEVEYNPDEPIFMPFSSGTTGLPKGVVLTQRNILATLLTVRSIPLIGKRVLFPHRIYHVAGIVLLLRYFLTFAKMHIFSDYNEESYLEAINSVQPQISITFLPQMNTIINHPKSKDCDMSSIEIIVSAGTTIPQEIRDKLVPKLPSLKCFSISYGLTEFVCGTVFQFADFEKGIGDINNMKKMKPNTIGRVAPMTELKIVNELTGGTLGPNQKGEICLRGPAAFDCYWNNAEATSNTKIDGFVHTGDIGYYDEDGDVFYVQRSKELIKSYGIPVVPASIEAKLLTHECVKDVAVVGIYDKKLMDELPAAFIVKKIGYEDVTEHQLLEFINNKVLNHEKLRGGVTFINEIPRNFMGKVQRNQLREMKNSTCSRGI